MFSCITRGQKYCSRACQYARPDPDPPFSAVHIRECRRCVKAFISRSQTKQECSPECAAETARINARRYRVQRSFNCRECGSSVVTDGTCKSRTYCSATCYKRHHRKHRGGSSPRRRALSKGAKYELVSPMSVMERFGYKCAECGIQTPLELRGANQHNSPEIDHITALAAGGDHVQSNLQLLCRECNAVKSDGNYFKKVMAL